jgi:hypothetical protein
MLDSEEDLNGPAPTIFSSDPTATMASISADSARTFADLAKILRTIASLEHISLQEARDIIANPREGNSAFPFKKPRGGKKSNPTPKKQKTSSQASGGNVLF